MKLLLASLILGLWFGCAPLTPPVLEGSPKGGTVAGQGQETAKPSALQGYLEARHLNPATAAGPPYVAVVRLVDRSEFRRGVWDIEQEMARLLSARLAVESRWQVVPYEAVDEAAAGSKKMDRDQALAAGQLLEADLVLLGTIRDFNMERMAVGDPLLGGYKSYKGTAELEVQVLRVQDRSELGVLEARQESLDRDLGLDLLGKPRPQDLQFTNLAKMSFGGEEFKATAIGQATFSALDDVVRKLGALLQPDGLRLGQVNASILSVNGEEVYIDLGSENGLRPGHRFAVFPAVGDKPVAGAAARQRVGVVEVQEVIGGRLSRVRVLEGAGQLRAGDRLEPFAPGQ